MNLKKVLFIIALCIIVLCLFVVISNVVTLYLGDTTTIPSNWTPSEVEEFNDIWSEFRGKQVSKKIELLFDKLQSNAKENEKVLAKIPRVFLNINEDTISASVSESTIDEYNATIDKMKSNIADSHLYNVTFSYADEGNISEIHIDIVSL